MTLNIPGTTYVEGREFMYVECLNFKAFSEFFLNIHSYGKDSLPSSGGIINEEIMIELPNGKRMFGLSFKGDLLGWRSMIIECCEINNLDWGRINNQSITISKGKEFSLLKCNVIFSE